MSQELHAADACKSSCGTLFTVFGEPDVALARDRDDTCTVRLRGVDFLGGKDPYEKLKTALRAEIDPDAWARLYSAVSRPFPRRNRGTAR